MGANHDSLSGQGDRSCGSITQVLGHVVSGAGITFLPHYNVFWIDNSSSMDQMANLGEKIGLSSVGAMVGGQSQW